MFLVLTETVPCHLLSCMLLKLVAETFGIKNLSDSCLVIQAAGIWNYGLIL
jgi:hypothetical protein